MPVSADVTGLRRLVCLALGATATELLTAPLLAHTVESRVVSRELWKVWTFEPGVVLPLLALAVLYGVAFKRVRALSRGPVIARWPVAAAFSAGWVVTAVALVSPVDALGAALFSAHMAQHELLMIVAAPLLVLGTPRPILGSMASTIARASPSTARIFTSATERASAPVTAWVLHASAVLLWHLPRWFDAAVHNEAIHALQHLSFFGTAMFFWWGLLRGRHRSYGVGVVSVFTTALYTGVLGALLVVGPRPWYSAYTTSTSAFELTPLEDQQLGGLIMWVPAAIVYTTFGLGIFAAFLRDSSQRTRPTASVLRGATTRLISVVVLSSLAMSFASCANADARKAAAAMTGGDPDRGRNALSAYGCATCHTIPGIREAQGLVGPPMTRIASRVYLAGRLTNTPENMVTWIQHPRSIDEKTAMPDTGVTEAAARDMAAYLYTLR